MTEPHEHLILKYLQGTLSDNEREAFEAWMNQSDDNRKTADDLQRVWQLSDIAKKEIDFGKTQEWVRLQKSLNAEMEESAVVVALKPTSYALRIAAAIAFLVVSSFLIYTIVFRTNRIIHETADQTLHIILPDGSAVWMNRNSHLSYHEDFAESRDVIFNGEGFFEVKPDTQHPFVVSTGEVHVKVLGTSFNMKTYPEELITEVFVVTGKVEFGYDDRNNVILIPGTKGIFNRKDLTLISEAEEDPNVIAWKEKRLVFKQTTLHNVIKALKSYFKTDIQVKNKALLNCRFTSEFNDPTLQEVIETLSVALDLQVVGHDNVYSLDGEGCKAQ